MEKRHKQFEYARMVMEKNRMELNKKPPSKFPKQPEKPGEDGAKRKTVCCLSSTTLNMTTHSHVSLT